MQVWYLLTKAGDWDMFLAFWWRRTEFGDISCSCHGILTVPFVMKSHLSRSNEELEDEFKGCNFFYLNISKVFWTARSVGLWSSLWREAMETRISSSCSRKEEIVQRRPDYWIHGIGLGAYRNSPCFSCFTMACYLVSQSTLCLYWSLWNRCRTVSVRCCFERPDSS